MTAPSPPRPAWRVGRISSSVTAMLAPVSFISPAGPMVMHEISSRKRAWRVATVS